MGETSIWWAQTTCSGFGTQCREEDWWSVSWFICALFNSLQLVPGSLPSHVGAIWIILIALPTSPIAMVTNFETFPRYVIGTLIWQLNLHSNLIHIANLIYHSERTHAHRRRSWLCTSTVHSELSTYRHVCITWRAYREHNPSRKSGGSGVSNALRGMFLCWILRNNILTIVLNWFKRDLIGLHRNYRGDWSRRNQELELSQDARLKAHFRRYHCKRCCPQLQHSTERKAAWADQALVPTADQS